MHFSMHFPQKLLLLLTATLLTACHSGQNGKGGDASLQAQSDTAEAITLEYARGFTVKNAGDGIRLVDVGSYHLALVPRGTDADVPEGYTAVHVPISRTICMTSLQLSNFTALGALDVVKGITGTKNLYNKEILQRVKEGSIVKIGMEGNFDTELILAAHPDVIFISPF